LGHFLAISACDVRPLSACSIVDDLADLPLHAFLGDRAVRINQTLSLLGKGILAVVNRLGNEPPEVEPICYNLLFPGQSPSELPSSNLLNPVICLFDLFQTLLADLLCLMVL